MIIDDLSSIHLELSTICNASCPQCPRNLNGGPVNPILPLTHLSLADVQSIFSATLIKSIKSLVICGNYGEGAAAPDALDSIVYLKSCNPELQVQLHTNGGLRSEEWWNALGKIIDSCVFGIDGLADTNHLHRRGVDWEILMRNVRAFIDAGGSAEWHFLIFKHNEHQLRDARAAAETLGFRRFVTKRSARFYRNGLRYQSSAVYGRDGKCEYVVESPTTECYKNPVAVRLESLISNGLFASATDYLEHTPIFCKASERQQIYVSAEGYVFPCCYTASIYNNSGSTDWRTQELKALVNSLPGGLQSISAKIHPLTKILQGELFKRVETSWQKNTFAEGRLATCAFFCGKCDFLRAQRAATTELRPHLSIGRRVTAAETYDPVMDTCIITSYYNPERYLTKRKNYLEFARRIKDSKIPFFVIELAFDNAEFELDDKNVFKIRSDSVMWQKERLLNLLIRQVSSSYSKIVWIDCDVLFERRDWLVRTSLALDSFAVVQPFSFAIRLPEEATDFDGRGEVYDGFAKKVSLNKECLRFQNWEAHGHTGFAWGVRSDLVSEVGLYDACIAGSADHLMAHAFCGDFHCSCLRAIIGYSSSYERHFLRWASAAFEKIKGKIGAVDGGLLHLWHGAVEDRAYPERCEELRWIGYDPEKHISIDAQGCWRWTGSNEQLERWCRAYFGIRREDSTNERA